MVNQRGFTLDVNTKLKDAGALTASAIHQVGGSNKVHDFESDGLCNFLCLLSVTAMDIASNDELYTFIVEGSDTSDFSGNVVELGRLVLGAQEVLSPDSNVDLSGPAATESHVKYQLETSNEKLGVRYRYLRTRTVIAGTSPSITFDAYLVPRAF